MVIAIDGCGKHNTTLEGYVDFKLAKSKDNIKNKCFAIFFSKLEDKETTLKRKKKNIKREQK